MKHSAEYKAEVLEFIRANSIKAAAEQYGISHYIIRTWIKALSAEKADIFRQKVRRRGAKIDDFLSNPENDARAEFYDVYCTDRFGHKQYKAVILTPHGAMQLRNDGKHLISRAEAQNRMKTAGYKPSTRKDIEINWGPLG